MARNFVLLHGAFHGGWCWAGVAARLAAAGHRVSTPTQTGLGERRHLLSAGITLDTFIQDVIEHLEAEEIEDAVLVGHSFAGIVISGVADRLRSRLSRLIYLDSRIIRDGECPIDNQPPEVAARRRAAAQALDGGLSCPPPAAGSFGVPAGPLAEWVARRLTPHPMGAFTTPLRLAHPLGNGLPCAYIACTDPLYATLANARAFARAQAGWEWHEIATGHDAMVTAPDLVATVLQRIAA